MSDKHFYFYIKTLNKNWQIDKTIFISSNRDIIINRVICFKSGGAILSILKKNPLTQEDIDQLNMLLSDPQHNSLKKVVRKILGEEVDEKEVERQFQNLRKRISRQGYRVNPETKFYELKHEISKDNKNNKDNKKPKTEKQVVKTEQVKEEKKIVTTPKKARRTKKEIEAERIKAEYEENLKINPLGLYSRTGHEITDKLFHSSKDETIGTGVYLLPSVVKEFKAVEEVFSHVYNYKLVDAAIQLTYSNSHYLMDSNVFMDFMKLMNKDKLILKHEETRRKELLTEWEQRVANGENIEKPKFPPSKKQLNLKLSQTATKNLDSLCKDFSMFTKSEVINLCMFALSESAKTTFLKK